MKKQARRSKSQAYDSNPFDNEVIITVILSKQEQITFPIPSNCPLQIINSNLIQKISDRQSKKVVGFQSVPHDYSFDYKLSKNIGTLNDRKNITLNCLYQHSTSQNCSENLEKSIENSPFDIQLQYFKKIAKYKICKPLSSGGFSRVYLIRNLENGQFYAAKFMEKDTRVNVDREEAIKNEFLIHKSLNHPFIVKMQEYFETEGFFVLIMEYCPGGQLFTLLKNNRYMIEKKARVIFIQILMAIKYLHDRNIVFRDIKPENILIDAFGNAKVTDFGLAKQIREKTNSYCGSVQYMAPQIISKQSYSFDVDLYCMGALLYEILIGCPPFYNPNFTNNETKYHICNSQVCFPRKIALSEEVKDLISSLLVKNPTERLGHVHGVDEILEHQWIGEISTQAYLNGDIKNPFLPNLDIENFDRQEDQNEMAFRDKILNEFRKCKLICNQMQTFAKTKQNSQINNKPQKIFASLTKHVKSKSQDEFQIPHQKKTEFEEIKPIKYSIKKQTEKENPYSFTLKNKSMSQMIYCYKNREKTQFDQKIAWKKKKVHPTLNKSTSKTKSSATNSIFDPETTLKSELNKILMINSKSCGNSRKNSLYKKFIQNNQDNKSNKLEFMSLTKKAKIFQPNIRHQSIAEHTLTSKDKQQTNPRKKSLSKQKCSSKQYTEFFTSKQVLQKQSSEAQKGLKKKIGNKKYTFASAIKEADKNKNSLFTLQGKNSLEKQKYQNRQTLL